MQAESLPRGEYHGSQEADTMTRKVFSFLLLILGIIVGLGGIGHAFGGQNVHLALDKFPIDPHALKMIYEVWYSMGAGMFLFGVMIVAIWFKRRKGATAPLFIVALIGIFYVMEGIGGWIYRPNDSFMVVFIVVGGLLMLCSYILRPEH
jgi:hypothetical protein